MTLIILPSNVGRVIAALALRDIRRRNDNQRATEEALYQHDTRMAAQERWIRSFASAYYGSDGWQTNSSFRQSSYSDRQTAIQEVRLNDKSNGRCGT